MSIISSFFLPSFLFVNFLFFWRSLPYSCFRKLINFCSLFTGKYKGVSWGLISRSEGRGPTNPLPTPYQHPINTLLTPYQPRTFSGENKSGLGCYDCYSVYRVSCSVFSVLSSMSRVLTFFTSYPLLFTSCLLTSI